MKETIHEGHEEERVSTELTENTEKSGFFRVFREFRGHSFFFVSFVDESFFGYCTPSGIYAGTIFRKRPWTSAWPAKVGALRYACVYGPP
ncbi:MAG: hypothetical protein BECKG1743D_GA0114223_100623 [Candidatus Kentron sp. G]|nr:MAG: hypothetical protein BECKG1743E_GA0114224_100138 [Candidatus Kentron sp. G]VFM98410.1 MAG: hypothetical protein BECKG1743D_GA0114223_100623 [Candidatus Kentron sp. G]